MEPSGYNFVAIKSRESLAGTRGHPSACICNTLSRPQAGCYKRGEILVTEEHRLAVITYEARAMKSARQNTQTQMKRNLLTLLAIGSAIALGGFAFAQAGGQGAGSPGGHGAWHGGHGSPLEHITETLNLTPDQQAKIQPIVDQAKPQIIAIHEDAMQKTKAIMDNVMSQIRPMLTPEQQAKADSLQKAHQDMMNAAKEMHDAHSK